MESSIDEGHLYTEEDLESVMQSKEIDEKENKVEASCGNNSRKTLSALTSLPSNNTIKNEFGPLSPVHLNVGSSHTRSPRTLSKSPRTLSKSPRTLSRTSGIRSRQEQLQKVAGVMHQHMADNEIKTTNGLVFDENYLFDEGNSLVTEVAMYAEAEEEEQLKKLLLNDRNVKVGNPTKEFVPDENFVYEEGDSLITEVALFAAAEEEKQLKKLMGDDQTANPNDNNILGQSKKLVGFLGGSIRTALQQNLQTDVLMTSEHENKADNVDAAVKKTTSNEKHRPVVETSLPDADAAVPSSEDPNLQRLNNFVGDLIGKLGSINPSPMNNVDELQHEPQAILTHDVDGTTVRTEDITTIDDKSQSGGENSPVPEPKSKYWETLMLRSEEPRDTRYDEYCESPSPPPQQNVTLTSPEEEGNQAGNVDSTESKFIDSKTPIVDKKKFVNSNESNEDQTVEVEPSPQSMISIPVDYSPGAGAPDNKNSPNNKGIPNREDTSPGSLMFNMISAATNTETPLICKSRLSLASGASVTGASPAVSEFANMISSAATAQTPEVGVSSYDAPAVTDFTNLFSNSIGLGAKQTSIRGHCESFSREKKHSKTVKYPLSINPDANVLDITPVKSNKTELFRRTSSGSLQSNCDESEDGSIYTSLTLQSAIESNTPRNRRVTEWLDPNASDMVSWPAPSMTSNLKTSDTPERQLPVTKMMAKNHTLQKQIRAKHKSSQKSELRLNRPVQVNSSTSPASLPSLLGSVSNNEVSDLESPNINFFALNFKFSDEESTIQSQSQHEVNEIQSIPDNTNRLHVASPQSLMTVETLTHEESKINSNAGKKHRLPIASPQSLMTEGTPAVGYPTDEECSNSAYSHKNVANNHHPKQPADTFSISTGEGSSSPHSTSTNGSFKRDSADDRFLSCLKLCIAFGIFVATVGAITVLTIASIYQTRGKQPVNSGEEWTIDISKQTSNPMSNINLIFETDSPTSYPTATPVVNLRPTSTKKPWHTSVFPLRPTSTKRPLPTGEPPAPQVISIPSSDQTLGPTAVDELSPTVSPTAQFIPMVPSSLSKPSTTIANSMSATMSPSLRPRPAPNPELDVEPSFKPTARPTFPPNIIPTFTSEKIQELTWDRIVKDDEIDSIPLWYLAADNKPGIELKVINAANGDRLAEHLKLTVDDYSRSTAVSSLEFTTVPYEVLCAPPEKGKIKVCSGDYGDTDWMASTIFFIGEDYIVSALIRINEKASSVASDALLQYALCHQVGHALGVAHNDSKLGLSSCMKDFEEDLIVDDNIIQTNQKLQHPNSDDLDYLVTVYGSAKSRMLRGH
jgi:hypothetical protein